VLRVGVGYSLLLARHGSLISSRLGSRGLKRRKLSILRIAKAKANDLCMR
jgi:hypothetical protein